MPSLARISGSGRALIGLALGGLALAGCQPVPHPFSDAQLPPDAPILQVADSVGILVEPVTHAPADGAVAEAMASALRDREIPADTRAANRQSYRLAGDAAATTIAAGNAAVDIQWTLRNAKGDAVGQDRQRATLAAADWTGGNAAALAPLGKAEAVRIAAMIQEAPPVEHDPGRQIFIRPTEGAPGDGRTALPRSLGFLLTRAGVKVTPDSQTVDAVVVAPIVELSSKNAAQQHVRITWHIYRPDGTEAGQVSQENDVPAGSLDHTWGDIGMAVATAGADQIMGVVNMIPLKNPIAN
ncbi:hypothetical protein GCM10011611_12100 [Aliidongia dinghuensis]|uniref:Uncharacterized protein n=1 Tax=Aliidongia dinghuensis TaxID=1867774 RepID=A0A8J2YQT0_9PROT|nr:hypothetical protein [Aliidongia dinghuensis]GGF08264.1 hypothetical protein GCM10011611_12100 [Aliidongia dinghuensis]